MYYLIFLRLVATTTIAAPAKIAGTRNRTPVLGLSSEGFGTDPTDPLLLCGVSVGFDVSNSSSELLEVGTLDSGTLDSVSLDSGSLDSSSLDSGSLDSGPLDSESLDSGDRKSVV